MDNIEITGLRTNTRIGVHAWEQRILQRLLIDLSINHDLTNCADQLANTIDYDQLCQRIISFVENNSFQLIETVAEQIAQLVKDEFKVTALTVRVSKPDAIKQASNIAVTICR
ncbi:MAG: dihydroneopterin aldolase [Legionella sp.]